MNLARRSLLLAILALPLVAHAQQSTGASVTGIVLCADTNAPARFAKVLLKPAAPSHAGDDFMKEIQDNMQKAAAAKGNTQPPPAPSAEAQRQQRNLNRTMNMTTEQMSGGTTDMDGHYLLDDIAPGTYFVHVQMAGYVDPLDEFSDDEITSTDANIRAHIAQKVPMITINGPEKQHIDIRLDRGASISGHILYDDGSPAAGWIITAVRKRDLGDDSAREMSALSTLLTLSGGATAAPRTDDLGNFRISGLAAGDYILRANFHAGAPGGSGGNILAGMGGINLMVYSGNTFRTSDAKPITLTTGELRADANINVALHSLHNIRGHVIAQSDSHAVNGGMAMLTSKDDSSLHLIAPLDDIDGSFTFHSLPVGNYTISISGASDEKVVGSNKLLGMTMPKTETTHKYGSAKIDVSLADADTGLITISVPEAKPGDKEENPFTGLLGLASGDDK